jgi:hypothetical protein
MSAPPRAIETSYGGCRFRSRLEARWAVFFDTLGIAWQYEPQGYVCHTRITRAPDGLQFPYLPDFWLGIGVHAEVKGHLTPGGYGRLIDAAACLENLLVCGEIPARIRRSPGDPTFKSPTWLRMHKGGVYASAWPDGENFSHGSPHDRELANDAPEWVETPEYGIGWLVHGSTNLVPPRVERAFDAARSARFEHGQSGGPR